MLQRFSLFEEPEWDLQYVAEKMSFLGVIDRTVNQMEEALGYGPIEPSSTSENISFFSGAVAKMRKQGVLFKVQAESLQSASREVGNLHPHDMMEIENMARLWDQDWFDIMSGNWGGLEYTEETRRFS